MHSIHYLFTYALLLAGLSASGAVTDTVEARINVNFIGQRAAFNAELPVLAGIPGGRQPFYTYLWDFGDGHFSTDKTPEHQYSKPGDYEVTLYTVSNYDNGPRPKRPKRKIKVDSAKVGARPIASVAEQHFFTSDGIFKLTKNANALPGQDMVVIAGVKTAEKGRIFLLTNEKIFGSNGFVYNGQTTYNGESVLPLPERRELTEMWATVPAVSITQSGSPDYGTIEEISFEGEEAADFFSELYSSYNTITSYEVIGNNNNAQFSLINLEITPEMLADTNATVTITGVFIPEKGPARVHRLDVPVVTSHDPNKMSLKQARLSYRMLARRKKMTYKVQFQNDGEGDARNVRLEIKMPEVLDLSTFKLLNLYPKCDSCQDERDVACFQYSVKGADTMVFHFKDIALPGSKAPDITDKDSTQGFIRFEILPKKKLPNRPFRGQTDIYFDRNEPVTTNFATGRFRKGVSPIVLAGYHHFLERPGMSGEGTETIKPGLLFGAGFAPIAPYKKLFWQVEVYANTYRTSRSLTNIRESGSVALPVNGIDTPVVFFYERYDRYVESSFLQLRIVPAHVRYNFNGWFSGGVGIQAETTFNTSHRENRTLYPIMSGQEVPTGQPYPVNRMPTGKLNIQPFADINVGRVYLGPALGLRYIYGARQGQYGQLYAAWRF